MDQNQEPDPHHEEYQMGQSTFEKTNATKAGVRYEDWFGNNEADIQAKSGAAKHGYTESQKNAII
eukprot:9175983-Heterocapsa_arctica.AAC.1